MTTPRFRGIRRRKSLSINELRRIWSAAQSFFGLAQNEHFFPDFNHVSAHQPHFWADRYRDSRWEGLNPTGFRYGTGGVNAQGDAWGSLISDKRPGFLNTYSTTGVEEDKAELFANLIVLGKLLAERAQSDPVLKAKIERMKELLQDFCADIDDQFWIDANKVERPEAAG